MATIKIASNSRIYIDAQKLLELLIEIISSLPKQYRYVIGDKMQSYVIDMLHDIASAYLHRDVDVRIGHINEMQSRYEVLRTLIKVVIEKRLIQGIGKQALLIELLDSIGRQGTAWKNSLLKANNQGR